METGRYQDGSPVDEGQEDDEDVAYQKKKEKALEAVASLYEDLEQERKEKKEEDRIKGNEPPPPKPRFDLKGDVGIRGAKGGPVTGSPYDPHDPVPAAAIRRLASRRD